MAQSVTLIGAIAGRYQVSQCRPGNRARGAVLRRRLQPPPLRRAL